MYEKLAEASPLHPLRKIVPLTGPYLLVDDKKMLGFGSQDYLGLTDSAEHKKNAMRYLLEYGLAPADTYLEGGILSCEKTIEEKLSHLLGKESSVLFASIFEANFFSLSALSKNAVFFIDQASRPDLKEAALKSGALVKFFRHNDASHLESLLASMSDPVSKWIITESISSQEGDFFPFQMLCSLSKKHSAFLYVDDSQAIGIAGYDGLGLGAHQPEIDYITGAFNKACGAFGGYAACSVQIKERLLHVYPHFSRLSPPALGTIEASLELIPQMEGERKQLLQRAHWLRKELQKSGFIISSAATPLISIACANKEESSHLMQLLENDDILVKELIGSEGEARLQIFITAHHSPDDLRKLVEALKNAYSPR